MALLQSAHLVLTRVCVKAARTAAPRLCRTYAATTKSSSSSAVSKASKTTDSDKLGSTSAADLHPLPPSVKDAAKPSSDATRTETDEAGNSISPSDISSRPVEPGPSSPPTNAATAAPTFTGNGDNGTSQNISDWASSFSGMSTQPFSQESAEILEAPINEDDVEIKPDGLLYLPEIKYRRILNKAFGPGGWGLAPRGETNVGDKIVSREWALICLGR